MCHADDLRTKSRQLLQWHPAFYAGIQIELAEEADKLIFENEHQLGTKPKEIDVLIVKKDSSYAVKKNLGRIFRKYNIIEYKSPEDYLSIDDYYKVCGYAYFYKADTVEVDIIKTEDITITFVCKTYPRKLMRHLIQERGFVVTKQENGIYYINGDTFPVQMILTSELTEKDNFWLRNLTNDIREKATVEELFTEYDKHKDEKLYASVMDIIVRANRAKMEEVKGMCEALLELMKDELDASRSEGIQQGIQQGIKSLIEACKSLGASCEVIKNMLIEKFSITENEAEEYMQLYW